MTRLDLATFERAMAQIEDVLFPQLGLDVYERAMYYFFLRHTLIAGSEEVVMGLPDVAAGTSMSEWKARETIRSLDAKGCARISTSKSGHRIQFVLPDSIPGLLFGLPAEATLDVEEIDFYTGRRYVVPLLEREHSRCFYCCRDVTTDSCVLDHVVPMARGKNNSYRNIVVSCHECNSLKQDLDGPEFIRLLYRRNVLSQSDVEARIDAIADITAGRLVPNVVQAERSSPNAQA